MHTSVTLNCLLFTRTTANAVWASMSGTRPLVATSCVAMAGCTGTHLDQRNTPVCYKCYPRTAACDTSRGVHTWRPTCPGCVRTTLSCTNQSKYRLPTAAANAPTVTTDLATPTQVRRASPNMVDYRTAGDEQRSGDARSWQQQVRPAKNENSADARVHRPMLHKTNN